MSTKIILEGTADGWLTCSRVLTYGTRPNEGAENYKVEWEIYRDSKGYDTLVIKNGVTGFESWTMQTLLKNDSKGHFCICAGTPRKWDRLYMTEIAWKNIKTKYLKTKQSNRRF